MLKILPKLARGFYAICIMLIISTTISKAHANATISVTSVVCTSEALLPNWEGGADITSTTATDYVAATPGCSLASGWDYQWGYGASVLGLNADFVGEADGHLGAGTYTSPSEWKTFGSTNASGVTTISAPVVIGDDFWVREVLKPGYLPFTMDDLTLFTLNDVSPEFYCHDDVGVYDNFDAIYNPVDGATYYCVSFNVSTVPPAPTISGSFLSTPINAGTNYSLNWTSTNATTVTPSCTGNASASISSQSFTPVGGNTLSVASDNTMYGTTTCVLVANGAGGTATSSSFSIKINPLCPATATWDGSACVNPTPALSITPMNKTIVIGQAFDYTITANDQGTDLDFTKLQWMAPGQSQWNYENSSYGAIVTPADGYQIYSPTSSSSVTFSFTPTVAGTYTIVATVRDNTSSRWTSTTTTALVVNCPSGYLEVANDCVNPLPSVSVSPTGTNYVQLGSSINLISTSTDASGDIVAHNITWIKPNGQDRYAVPGQEWGAVSYSSPASIPAGTGTSTQIATFTPDHVGYYTVRFAAQDNTLSNYNGEGPRWTYSLATTIAVVNGTTATMIQDPSNTSRIRWECFNSNVATLVTTGGPTTYDFTNRTLPPSSGTFPSSPGATYTLTCRNTSTGEQSTMIYAEPTIVASNIGTTQADITYNCNNASAQSSTIERSPGDIILYPTDTSGARTDILLAAGTEYIYTLRCFSAPGGTGAQVGATTVRVTTVTASPPAFTISAYIQRVVSDPSTYSSTQPITTSTPDGQFYAWSYQITGGNAQSCTMDQRNDNSGWYPSGSYASATSTYTLLFSSLSPSDRAGFASSFTNAHYWRLTCSDSLGRSKSLTWSLDKTGAFPTVVDATLNLNCNPAPPAPTISVQCANADYYEVRNNTTNALVGSGAGTIGTVSIGNANATYRVTCKQGGSGGTANAGQYLRTYNSSMCGTTITNFTATPRTIKAGSVTTLQWTISQPTASCTLTAQPVCTGPCSPAKTADAATLNTKISTENTDANDPNNINDTLRSITNAIQSEAFNNGVSGKAIGKKSLKVNYTTDFILNCSTSTPGQKVRIQVSNDTQG
jgi:hypothetical protein